jgi:hypothetical protein
MVVAVAVRVTLQELLMLLVAQVAAVQAKPQQASQQLQAQQTQAAVVVAVASQLVTAQQAGRAS